MTKKKKQNDDDLFWANDTNNHLKRKILTWGVFIEIDNKDQDTYEVILPEKINDLVFEYLFKLEKKNKLPTQHNTKGKLLW